MKRAYFSLFAALAFAACATTPVAAPNNQLANQVFFVTGCTSYTPSSVPLNGAECIDLTTGGQSYWNATSAAFIAGNASFNMMAAQVAGITVPTSGTGTVTAGGNNSIMEVTGGTSPVTVTFGTAFVHKPFCLCGDETSATGVCKVVPNANGATAVVTTASTDSFVLQCVANGS